MKKAEEYRQNAAECRLLASRLRSPEERAMLNAMADTWESLAVDRAAHVARQERLVALEAAAKKTAEVSIPIDKLNASNDD
jgi:hypothetical protein